MTQARDINKKWGGETCPGEPSRGKNMLEKPNSTWKNPLSAGCLHEPKAEASQGRGFEVLVYRSWGGGGGIHFKITVNNLQIQPFPCGATITDCKCLTLFLFKNKKGAEVSLPESLQLCRLTLKQNVVEL